MRGRRTSTRRAGTACALILACVSCGLPPMVSDTGYKGTWRRANERNESLVAITEVGGRYYFRWIKRSFDGKFRVDCGWDGHCEERLNGQVIATYTMTARYDPATGKLYTDTLEERIVPQKMTYRYTDVMEVADRGLTLWNFTIDRNEEHYEGDERPSRSFEKLSNSVADPPHPPRAES